MFKGVPSLEKSKEQQKDILKIVEELKKKIDTNRHSCPISKENKDDAENLIESAEEIFRTRRDIINVYKKSRNVDIEEDEDEDKDEDEKEPKKYKKPSGSKYKRGSCLDTWNRTRTKRIKR